ncbi:hypothetical protein Godav_003982 [Gossypium davidsonii]|uniref:Uncharacterized protein n=1 Tax=Gossypium davidsonii TaxID=34287 RepID=A0A7J8SJP4_GOSDV|nr:hypothetical protein [Gossypium davidsonii]
MKQTLAACLVGGNRNAFPPIQWAHHQTNIWLAGPITPVGCNSHSLPQTLIRDSIPYSFFLFHFLPSSFNNLLLHFPSIDSSGMKKCFFTLCLKPFSWG